MTREYCSARLGFSDRNNSKAYADAIATYQAWNARTARGEKIDENYGADYEGPARVKKLVNKLRDDLRRQTADSEERRRIEKDLESLVETGWQQRSAGICFSYWLPGIYGGYVFTPRGANYSLRSEPLVLGGAEKDAVVGLGSAGLSFTPTPYFALLLGFNVVRVSVVNSADASLSRSYTLVQPAISIGGTLDIFTKLIR
ncbi:hypothetical protein [Nannocystis sp. SCPEA4]|uniref:hypothetical protein n=1 Tax=Nannocystis sp. SCPEA4 TaxID=2996787 RepID=UPI00226DC523|nr:hypothetical protein [Nannocystis sp. SCPEA4]MCY1061744.1 hypothetical protein [Nannocystis sp. SCPEA4]